MTETAPTKRPVIFLVDDDPVVIRVIGRTLGTLAEVRFSMSASEALIRIREEPPTLILLDEQLGSSTGLAVHAQLRADQDLCDIPVIFVTSHDDEALEVAALEQGAVDFITKPIRPAPLLARVKTHLENLRLKQALREQASNDGLTGIANRRRFDEALERHWRLAARGNMPLSLLLLDVDFFKAYNDHYGHQAGDDCLRTVARVLHQQLTRTTDILARYGGEEFVMLLPNTPRVGAMHLAQSVLQALKRAAMPHAHSQVCDVVTASIGVSTVDAVDPAVNASALVRSADRALYDAKHHGRDCVRYQPLTSD